MAGNVGGAQVEATDFCCPEYITQMVAAIKTKWNDKQSVVGITGMKFTILRDGTITAIQVEKPSGLAVLDNESRHALDRGTVAPSFHVITGKKATKAASS